MHIVEIRKRATASTAVYLGVFAVRWLASMRRWSWSKQMFIRATSATTVN